MVRKYFFSLLLLLFFSIFYTRCTTNKFDIDVSGIDLDMEFQQLDQDIFYKKQSPTSSYQAELKNKYGEFYTVFVEQIIRIGSADSLKTIQELEKFTEDSFVRNIEDHIQSKFPEKKIIQFNSDILSGFKHYRYYFPQKKIPKVVYYNSGFNYGIVTLENHLGIGLDFYLGAQDSLIKLMPGEVFHQYEKDKMDEKYLVRDGMDGWLRKEFENYQDKSNLLSLLVYEGKITYLLQAMFPNMPEELIMRYSSDEMIWAKKNKKNIWRELAKQKIIFGTKNFDNQKWITEGPFTNVGAIPEDSPARLGGWMGWNMVRAFMDKHPDWTVQQLLEEKNYPLFLNAYKP